MTIIFIAHLIRIFIKNQFEIEFDFFLLLKKANFERKSLHYL